MDFHIRIHRWVFWWFWLGIVLGAIALANILIRDMPRAQEKVVLLAGVIHWLLGGLVCYAVQGIRFEKPREPREPRAPATMESQQEWHSASDFLLPGNRKSLLHPKY